MHLTNQHQSKEPHKLHWVPSLIYGDHQEACQEQERYILAQNQKKEIEIKFCKKKIKPVLQYNITL